MKTIKLLPLLLIVMTFLTCKKTSCDVTDFLGTVSVNWISFGNGCSTNLPTNFSLIAADTNFFNPGDDVWMLHQDTAYYRLFFNGPNEDGCLFQFEEVLTNKLAGDGILVGDDLEFRYKDNGGAVTCSFRARIE